MVKIKSMQVTYRCPKTKKTVSTEHPNFVVFQRSLGYDEQGQPTQSYTDYRVDKCPGCGKSHSLDLD